MLPQPIVALVTDANGDPVSGVTVTMTPSSGDGFLSVGQAKTDPQGRVAAQWTLGAHAGPQSATASVTGLTGSPVTFGATATTIGTLSLLSGDGQTGADGSVLLPLVVEVRNNSNVVQQGVTVTWQVTSGGGSLDAASDHYRSGGSGERQLDHGPRSRRAIGPCHECRDESELGGLHGHDCRRTAVHDLRRGGDGGLPGCAARRAARLLDEPSQ